MKKYIKEIYSELKSIVDGVEEMIHETAPEHPIKRGWLWAAVIIAIPYIILQTIIGKIKWWNARRKWRKAFKERDA